MVPTPEIMEHRDRLIALLQGHGIGRNIITQVVVSLHQSCDLAFMYGQMTAVQDIGRSVSLILTPGARA